MTGQLAMWCLWSSIDNQLQLRGSWLTLMDDKPSWMEKLKCWVGRDHKQLFSQGLVEGGGPSPSQKCPSGRMRCEQQPLDHQAGMKGRVVCHQRSCERKSHVSESQTIVMLCRWRRVVVQALSLEALHLARCWVRQLTPPPYAKPKCTQIAASR